MTKYNQPQWLKDAHTKYKAEYATQIKISKSQIKKPKRSKSPITKPKRSKSPITKPKRSKSSITKPKGINHQ